MIQTVRVQTTTTPDLLGDNILNEIHTRLKNKKVIAVKTARVYRLEDVGDKEVKLLAEKLFSEPINQRFTINKPILETDQLIEIAYKPGVMNPEIASIMKVADDLNIQLKAADSSWEYGFVGKLDKKDIISLIEKLRLFNPLIEHIVNKEPQTLIIKGEVGKTATIPIRTMTDQKLMELSKDTLFLNLEELKVIQKHFQTIKRDPTDCELETLAQTWSEHCAHKTFKAKLVVDNKEKTPLITRIKNEALKHNKHIVSAFIDNAGVMDFYDGWAINGKGETHNAPSAIEPYGGTMTGNGGVFRDVVATGEGAKTLMSTDIFCLAPPDMDKNKLPDGTLPPDYMLKRVVAAVRDYDNRVGIPTNNGSFHFHNDFRAKPVVLAGAYGILPKNKAKKGEPKIGDVVVIIGGRTGRDGIHGATFSSGEMTERTSAINAQAVQIGNAIEEKRMFDAILEARDQNLIRAIQDLGAGGFSSAIGEMGEKTGVTVKLDKAPLKYPGLSPWEIWISESQERMALAIPQEKVERFISVCKKYNVEYAMLGAFDGDKQLKVFFEKELVCNLPMEFLHHGLPQRIMIATKPKIHLRGAYSARLAAKRVTSEVAEGLLRGGPTSEQEWLVILEKILSHWNVCSKEPIVRRYDHTVQGTNVLQPFSGELLDGPNDAAIIRPLLNKSYGMVVSHGLNPVLNNIDPYWGSLWAATEAMANYVAVGGDYKKASLINNYIWPFPDEDSLWSLDQSVDAVVDYMKLFKIPVISGKDSLSATYRNSNGTVIKIPPVLCISVFGKIPDVAKTMSADFKRTDSIICLVGNMDYEAMEGSTYFDSCHPELVSGSSIPHVDFKNLPKVFDAIHNAIKKDSVLAVHDISEGGLMTAIFEMCVGGNAGAELHLGWWPASPKLQRGEPKDSSEVNIRPDFFLFNETAGCFIVEVANEQTAKTLFKNIPFTIIGKTKKEKTITVNQNNKNLFSVELTSLKQAWQKPMKEIFG